MDKRKTQKKSQGWAVFLSSTSGLIVGLLPLSVFANPTLVTNIENSIVITGIWVFILGTLFTYWLSNSLHQRINQLKPMLINRRSRKQSISKGMPIRLPWIPFWLGIFERIFFALLIGLKIDGTGAFIGAWIGIKLASGWGTWSAGEAYGRAIFFAGILGSALSLLYGISAGLVLQQGLTLGQ